MDFQSSYVIFSPFTTIADCGRDATSVAARLRGCGETHPVPAKTVAGLLPAFSRLLLAEVCLLAGTEAATNNRLARPLRSDGVPAGVGRAPLISAWAAVLADCDLSESIRSRLILSASTNSSTSLARCLSDVFDAALADIVGARSEVGVRTGISMKASSPCFPAIRTGLAFSRLALDTLETELSGLGAGCGEGLRGLTCACLPWGSCLRSTAAGLAFGAWTTCCLPFLPTTLTPRPGRLFSFATWKPRGLRSSSSAARRFCSAPVLGFEAFSISNRSAFFSCAVPLASFLATFADKASWHVGPERVCVRGPKSQTVGQLSSMAEAAPLPTSQRPDCGPWIAHGGAFSSKVLPGAGP